MATVYFSIGANLGNKEAQLNDAIEQINKQIGNIISQSAFYTTEPWGYQSNHTFLNAAIGCETTYTPKEVLEQTQLIELEMGRKHKSCNGEYADRLIDIDMLLFDNLIIKTDVLTIPHPLMHKRLFVMEPLNEIAPDVIHPVLHKSIQELFHLIS